MYLSTFLNKKNVKIYVEKCLTCAMNPQSIKLDVEYPFHEQYLSVYDCTSISIKSNFKFRRRIAC